jgi:phosphoribosylcarboxyaminoimidazole (NCAIR) mutase
MDGVSASELSQATNLQQAGLLAVRNAAQQDQAIAQMLTQQAQQIQQTVTASSNPDGVGSQVDTYA